MHKPPFKNLNRITFHRIEHGGCITQMKNGGELGELYTNFSGHI